MQVTKWDIKRIMLKLYWELKGLEKAIEAELPHAPGWVGQRKQRTGEEVKYWFHYEGGKCKAMRIPKEQEEEYTKMVTTMRYRAEELRNVKKQLKQLQYCLNVLKLDPEKEKQHLKAVTKKVVNPTNVPYAQNRRHPTLKGDFVRSKSEALLADLLFYHGIEYEYEKELVLNGQVFYPDFTLPRFGGRVFYWEHLGMSGDPNYDRNWGYKSRIYAENGITEGNGLIITRDVNGVFDELDALHKIDLYQLSNR